MVQKKLPATRKPEGKSAAPAPVEPDSDDDVVMVDTHPESSSTSEDNDRPSVARGSGSGRSVVLNVGDGPSKRSVVLGAKDEDGEMEKVTKGTRMLMVSVEIPKKKRQTTVTDFFSPTAKDKSKEKGKAVANVSGSRRSSKKIISDSEEDDYVPEELSEPEAESDEHAGDESEPEEEAENSEDEGSSEDEKASRKKKKGKAPAAQSDQKGKKKKEKHKSKPKPCGLNIDPRPQDQEGGLPPISNLSTIFDDILARVIPYVEKLMGAGKHRKLRVATMCSGTESPLLALDMFSKAIKARSLGHLEIEHVFSCEIEPFKQAYIERNFKPPILFRDIKELGGEYATTAYGTKVKVPGDIDILIAGTSCVDFSGLNNKKKGLGEGGESSDTFYGMMAWIQNHRPLIVIQENVCGADWAGMRLGYMEQGYAAEFSRLDSKLYYIPHTRTRVYLCAVNIKGSDIPNKWVDAMTKMRRKCTATLEDYMLPDDDPRVYKARMELSGDPRRSGPSKARTVEWEKCEGRHQRERIFKKLGLQRPVTAWQEGGVSKALDFMWQDWTRKQVERVLDLMDINFLLSVRDSKYDPMYKAAFWNLSQNVDRNTMGGKPDGISPCLTPHMIPYLCYRGGPMTGIESLHMQGLPIDELLLTKETSQQIQNLAGNAMTSTVVGTSMLCALILALDHLPVRLSEDSMVIDQEEDIESHIIGEEDLEQRPLDLSKTVSLELRDLLNDADRSRRLCVCEGRFAVTENKIRLCKECGFTACDKCGGRPSHVVPENEHTPEFDHRIQPLEFELKLKSILPMKLRLDEINEAALEALKAAEGVPSVKPEDWRVWCELVLKAVKGEFRFKTLVRQETWTVMYDAPDAKLELILNSKKPEWRIFAKCPEMEGVESHRRKLCELPVARMFIQSGKNALSGQWELCLPIFSKFDVLIQGIGQKIPSWQRTLGYTDSATMTSEVYSDLRIQVPDEHKKRFDRDISGDYKLLQTCGTAQGALHIKRDNDGQPPLFFFIDQKRTGDDVDDSFVFSESHRRLAYGDYRSVIAKLVPKWRQSNASDDFSKVQTQVNGHWVAVKALFGPPIDSNSSADGVVLAPGPKGLDFHVSNEDCKSAHTVLECKVPLRDYAEPIWPKGKWVEVDSIHERLTYESLAWLTERVRSMKQLEAWSSLELPVCGLDECQRCAPRPPQLKWFFIKNRYTAIEDPQEAAPYERALKSRPSPFVTQITLDEDNVGVLKIGLNVATLIHRALFRMSADGRGKPMLSWRLVTDYIPEPRLLLPFYKLSSNKNDQESAQPPSFRQKLRPEQLRSLTWMKAQEEPDIAPFIEEEVAEALLPHLNWRAEGKAERPNYVRGGVLADEVGYGKTAITIGLIDSTQANIKLPEEMPGAIPVKATLVIVPQHLSRQWASEIVKFTGSKYRVLSIGTQADMNKLTARKIMEADIIIAQAGLFQSDKYLSNLAHFAGAAKPPSGQGRRFFDWQAKALADLAIQVEHLKERGAKGAWARIQEASRRREREEAAETFVPTKRLVGKAYQEEKAAKAAQGSKRRRSSETGDSDAESVDTEESSDRTKKARTTKTNQDPWGLQKQLVERDWKNMATPPFEMFYFNRLVVDEFTYYKGQIHAGITSQKSMSRWVLSGTPPLDDFTDVKTIADFLNIHLGIDDDSVGKEGNKKKIRKDMTSVEQFTAFREVRSPHWHTRRQQVAQAFLNQFVRQNFAEIEEIPWEEHIVPIQLPAAERAIYLELDHFLQALDYNIKKSKAKVDNDRDRRQQEALGNSKTAEEALIKRCSHFDLDSSELAEEKAGKGKVAKKKAAKEKAGKGKSGKRKPGKGKPAQEEEEGSDEEEEEESVEEEDESVEEKPIQENAVQACDYIVADRKKQLSSCREDIRRTLRDALAQYEEIPKDEWQANGGPRNNDKRPRDLFTEFVEQCRNQGVGDPEANHDIRVLLNEAFDRIKGVKSTTKYSDGYVANPKISAPRIKAVTKEGGVKGDGSENYKLDNFEKIDQLKSKVIYLRGLARKELAGRHRSLRYFTVVRDLQKSAIEKKVLKVFCPGCKTEIVEASKIAVLSSCGHMGCYDCLEKAARLSECLADECTAATRALSVVRADCLGSEDKRDGIGRHHGKKLEKIVELIKDRIPKEDKILLFVQFPDLMEKVVKILTESDIKFFKIAGSGAKQSATVEAFQNDTSKDGVRVMLLNVTAESSSGANFTNANHAIFLSPLLTETEYEYRSSETQAIGRVRRYGQTKTVHIWRFMSEDTMDIETYEKRTGEKRNSDSFKNKIYKL